MTNVLVSLAALIAILAGQASTPVRATYVYNMYNAHGMRFQNPDEKACTAAATLIMLNAIAYSTGPIAAAPTPTATATTSAGATAGPSTGATAGPSATATSAVSGAFVWKPTVSYSKQESMLRWERANMTMALSQPGSDIHGWRNAMNYFGWGSMTAGVYGDLAYKTFDQAAVATVRSIAVGNMPVGILAWYGSHAQIVTGYSVTGEDPRTGSTKFKINGVYLSDPLQESHHWNYYVTYQQWKSGPLEVRFMPYYQTDQGVFRDPVDGKTGKAEWWGKFVMVGPILPQ